MDFALQASGSYDTVLEAARWAESRGLAAFALPDHYLMAISEEGVSVPAYDAFAQLSALARDTSSIRLSVLVSPITFRHPAVIAKSAVTIDELSGGRFTLGIGTGWMELEHEVFGIDFPPLAERFDRMAEALEYTRALTSGEGFAGDHYTLQERRLEPQPSGGFQIVVGGVGSRRTPELAGRFADEYNVYPAPIDEMVARINRARETAERSGRDPDEIMVSSSGAVLVGRDQDDYERKFLALAEESGATPDELEAHFSYRNTPRGPADRLRAQLTEMEEIGVSRFYVQTIWADGIERTEETFELLGA